MKDEDVEVYVQSIYGMKTQQALVDIRFGPEEKPLYRTQLTVLQAKKIAYTILDAVEGSITDAAIFEFFTKRMELPLEHVAAMIKDLREWRNKSEPRYYEE